MTTGAKIAMAIAGVVTLIAGLTSGAFGWFMWAVALNGFMGQTRAVDTSLIVYCTLAVASIIIAVALSVAGVYFTAKRGWNAAVSCIVSIIVFSTATGILHVVAIFISVIVADQLRTNR